MTLSGWLGWPRGGHHHRHGDPSRQCKASASFVIFLIHLESYISSKMVNKMVEYTVYMVEYMDIYITWLISDGVRTIGSSRYIREKGNGKESERLREGGTQHGCFSDWAMPTKNPWWLIVKSGWSRLASWRLWIKMNWSNVGSAWN